MATKRKPARRPRKIVDPNLECFFCKQKTVPTYKDYKTLSNFISDRARIYPTERSGVCSKHQRILSREIKRARFLALLPFVEKVN